MEGEGGLSILFEIHSYWKLKKYVRMLLLSILFEIHIQQCNYDWNGTGCLSILFEIHPS